MAIIIPRQVNSQAYGGMLSPHLACIPHRFAETFDMHTKLEDLPVTLAELLDISQAIVARKGRGSNAARRTTAPLCGTNSKAPEDIDANRRMPEDTDATTICKTSSEATAGIGSMTPNMQNTAHGTSSRGTDQAATAAARSPDEKHGSVIAFLPRNLDLQQLADYAAQCAVRPPWSSDPQMQLEAVNFGSVGQQEQQGQDAQPSMRKSGSARGIWEVQRNILNDGHFNGVTLYCGWQEST